MKQEHNFKPQVLQALTRLHNWVENNFEDSTDWQSPIGTLFGELEVALNNTQGEHGDIFGTEGYERSIMGKD